MPLAVLGLGANLGDREEYIRQSLKSLSEYGQRIIKVSDLYETEPYDVLSQQDNYLNCCVLLETQLSPTELLALCHKIEHELNRVRKEYHGARTIDLDILLYEGVNVDSPDLIIPHKDMLNRAFVLTPLADIFTDRNALGLNFSEALAAVDSSTVKCYKKFGD